MPKVLLVTNDFPPRPGGIQTFLHGLVGQLPPDDVVVYTSRWRGWEEWDAQQPFRVVREDTSVLLPTTAVRRRAQALLREHGCDVVWFGAAAPLGLLADALRRAGARRVVATTHGHEAGWAAMPVTRQLLRRIAASADVVTFLGDYTRQRLAGAFSADDVSKLHWLAPGVDTGLFRPGDGGALRDRLGLADRPVVVCVSRLMPRKGQDALIDIWPTVRGSVPGASLLLVGGGPARAGLHRRADKAGVGSDVVFTGSVPWPELPGYYNVGDAFAMPCRTRLGGVDVEGLGMVYLEASACGLPVIAGDSGGAPDTVLEGETGFVVGGRDRTALTQRVVRLLCDEELRRALGRRGREWIAQRWTWPAAGARLGALLAGDGD
jgi:phosphatidyl-myo-inositol dimannoside synthase